MRMAMMQGMMGMANPAMQMAMMQQMGGMVPPPYFHAMQQQQMMLGPGRGAQRGGGARGSSSSSGGSGSSSESGASSSGAEGGGAGGGAPGVLGPAAAAMAAMAAMWGPPGAAAAAAAAAAGRGGPSPPPPPPPPPPPGADYPPGSGPCGGYPPEKLEAFIATNPVEPEAADRLRALPPHLQQAVIRRGPITDTRNPSAVLIARIRDAESALFGPSDQWRSNEYGRGRDGDANDVGGDGGGFVMNSSDPPDSSRPARRSAKATIETMIKEYRLSAGCAWMLRALPPDKQKLAARIDPAGQSDPSGYVAEQLKKIV